MLKIKQIYLAAAAIIWQLLLPAYAGSLYLTNAIPQHAARLSIVCNNQYGGDLFFASEGQIDSSDWKMMVVQMDWERRDYSCNVLLLPYGVPPYTIVGHFEIIINQDFSGALLKSITAQPGYQYKITTGSVGAITPDIGLTFLKQ